MNRVVRVPTSVAPRRRAPSFAALDFETADYGRDSACALAVVRVEGGTIVAKEARLIRPPRQDFVFTYLHGIAWEDVAGEPEFPAVWDELSPLCDGVDFLAAHNASFDRSVLRSCCEASGRPMPEPPFQCTVRLARDVWNLYPTKLNNVCDYLHIPLQHHDAASDAEACARIVLAALADGVRL
jgi:DNA polymerase-3 subunit epsilon